MYRKNVASQNLGFGLVNATTGAALTGATVSAYRSIDGGAQAAVTGTVSELANGQYNLALSQADTNGNNISFLFTATNAIPLTLDIVTTDANPYDAVRFGLSALPNAAAAANGGLATVDASNAVKVQSGTGANQISLSSGLVSLSGTQTFNVTGNITGNLTGSVGSVSGAVGSVTGAVGSVAGNVGGNVVGTVGSVVGNVGGNVSGNVDGTVGGVTMSTLNTNVTAIKAKTDNLPQGIRKNTSLSGFTFTMVDSTDHITGKTGLTVTATRSLDGAAFAACANSVTEISNGAYVIDLAAADLNANTVMLKFSATGADTRFIQVFPQT
jgi:hypothetical protein